MLTGIVLGPFDCEMCRETETRKKENGKENKKKTG